MLLDALTYIIDADNRKLDAEIKGSEQKVDELGKSMSEAEKRAKDMQDRMVAGFKRVGGAILASIAVSKTLSTVSDYAATVDSIRSVSESLGVAVEDVDAFTRSVESMGGTADGAQASLQALGQKVGEGLKDAAGSGAERFKELGISLKDAQGQAKDTVTVMGELADAVAGMERQQAIYRLQDMGISDQKTIELMLRGRQEMERLMRSQKDAGVITKKSAEEAHKYTLAMARFRQGNQRASESVARVILPILTRLVNGFSSIVEWMQRHGDFIKGFFIALATVLAVVYGPAVISAAIGTWALIAPFVAVAAVIGLAAAAFALIYDDIVNFMEGNDSLIGQISEQYPAIGEYVKALYNVVSGIFKLLTGDFEGAKEAFSAAATSIKNVFGAMGDAIINVLDSLFQWFGMGEGAATKMADDVTSVFEGMANAVKGTFQGLIAFVKRAWEWIAGIYEKAVGMVSSVGSWFGGKLGFGGDATNGAGTALSTAAANPLNSTTSQAIANTTNARTETNVSVGQVNVQTQATDASGISKDIGSELSGQLKSLQTEAASGMAR